ncbi:MAG: helix-turn-helix domain-containing protein [Planctomycetes bacterium]|nr:helix-turn-helix domain-containing protein [Planctomycetota bacterium]MCC8115760.1 helix-turn-helix domain-containing protein [Planctomycetota bacterium]MCD7896316.1 helix-turn-helix domain-containing protein [Planctomycetaceae bacterium]
MLDKSMIAERFFSCHQGLTRPQVAKIYGVTRLAVVGWARRNEISWSKLKYFCDSQAVNWDWILEGVGEKFSAVKKPVFRRSKSPKFDTAGINKRYLSLFQNQKQYVVADELGVSSAAISSWKRTITKVPWEKMEYAVNKFGVRWDWLIDGLEPKYRNQSTTD